MKKKKNNKKHIITLILLFATTFYILKINSRDFLKEISSILTNNIFNILIQDNNNINYNEERDKVLEKEISNLKKQLDLKNTYTSYKVINSTVTIKNKSYWLDTINIDKGKKDGIKKDMAVVTINGLVGKIEKVYPNSSVVKLIISDSKDYDVSITISNNNGNYIGKISNYDNKNNLLRITDISKNSIIEKNDIITTSGLGGIFPKGIYIGKVEKVENDKYNLNKNVYVKINQDFNNIYYVGVLKIK